MIAESGAGQPARGSVLVVGSVNVDLVVRVSRLPAPGETVLGGTFASHAGGKGANQAVAASRLGAEVRFIGAVGDDDLGRSATADLKTEGVDTSGLHVLPDIATGVALIAVDERGENQITVASGANAGVDAALVEAALAEMSPIEGPAAYVANLEVSDEAVLAGARFGARHGWHLIINPAPARDLQGDLMALRPILVPNALEAEALTGEHDPVAAARVLAGRSAAPVIVTLGPQGAVVVDSGAIETLPAPILDAVDGTGAGDAFVGALAAELAAGTTLLEAARIAVRAASMSVTVPGARGGMPTRGDLYAVAG